MFDLKKDLDKYTGVPPYASEMYGVYQPLLGWRSGLTQKWVKRGGSLADPRITAILDAHIVPGPKDVTGDPGHESVRPLEPGSGHGRSPYRVVLARDLDSELLKLVRQRVQVFVDEHDGRLPYGQEWAQVVDINDLMDADEGSLRRVNDLYRNRLNDAGVRAANGALTEGQSEQVRRRLLALMQYESQLAALLLYHAEGQPGYDPAELEKLFVVVKAPPLSEVFRTEDPLGGIDPRDRGGALAPVGLVQLFRQYFFDLGTFLGEPVEHVWLAPGTTIELIEVSTRKALVERTLESLTESTVRAERSSTVADELSDAVKETNAASTKLGVSQTNTAKLYVYEGTASVNFGIEKNRSDAREVTHKQSREQTERLSQEIKQSVKSVFRTSVETTDTTSRRHILTNPGTDLVNYELRRKMRRVGVQIQSIGERLCWQVFVDNPGATLGLAELVHLVRSPELDDLKEPDKVPVPAPVVKKMAIPFPFKPVLDYYKNDVQYEYQGHADGDPKKPQLGIIKASDDDDSQVVIEHSFKVDPPQTGYELVSNDIRMLGAQAGKMAILRSATVRPDGAVDVVLQRVNFGGENVVTLDFEFIFAPSLEEHTRVADANKAIEAKYEEERARLVRQAYLEAVRKRIKDAAQIRVRPSWDLREEERTVVYRHLIRRLMLDSWGLTDNHQNRRLSHVRSELVRTLFDVDSMLYFVAPEWWMPRRHRASLDLTTNLTADGSAPTTLTDADRVTWGGENRPDNYPITEDSEPARLGSSLGWLLQLDGDNLRNAFLNAPWVKAVIPIRAGREIAAVNWLRSIEGHEQDGWDAPYLGAGPDDVRFTGKTVGEALTMIAQDLEQTNAGLDRVLQTDEVFEFGFDPLAKAFDGSVDPTKPFSQSISILPTEQIVATAYQPTELFET